MNNATSDFCILLILVLGVELGHDPSPFPGLICRTIQVWDSPNPGVGLLVSQNHVSVLGTTLLRTFINKMLQVPQEAERNRWDPGVSKALLPPL